MFLLFEINICLTPDEAVQVVPKQVEQGHHRHVKKEETDQTSSAEVTKKRIHPDSHGQIHPYNPAEYA